MKKFLQSFWRKHPLIFPPVMAIVLLGPTIPFGRYVGYSYILTIYQVIVILTCGYVCLRAFDQDSANQREK
jgi:hypothetical protein